MNVERQQQGKDGFKLGRGRRIRGLGVAAVLAVLAVVSVAQASIPIQNPKGITLDSKVSSQQSRFNLHLELGGSEHIKDMTTQLPSGLGVNPDFPLCESAQFTADACAANTQVGTTTVNVSVLGLVPQAVTGRLYYLAPDAASGQTAPGLGIILDNPAPFPKTFQRGETVVDGKRGGITTIVRNFPQSTGGTLDLPIRINSIDIVLSKDFIRVPGSCNPATTVFGVTSYEDPGTTSSASFSFTPTGCPPPPVPKCDGTKTTQHGTTGNDVIVGTKGRDVIAAFRGNDTIKGLGGDDILCGGKGKDKLVGGPGKDRLIGGPARDVLLGGPGKDTLKGGAGKDVEKP